MSQFKKHRSHLVRRNYAFTVKILSRKGIIDEKRYEPFFQNLYKFGKSVYRVAENDSKGILHYHGVVNLNETFYRKLLCIKGFHVKFKALFNAFGWAKYIHKNCHQKKIIPKNMQELSIDDLVEFDKLFIPAYKLLVDAIEEKETVIDLSKFGSKQFRKQQRAWMRKQ